MTSPILRYFNASHLKPGALKNTSVLFGSLAGVLDEILPDGAEKSVALRKLLEAKDAAVRSALDITDVRTQIGLAAVIDLFGGGYGKG